MGESSAERGNAGFGRGAVVLAGAALLASFAIGCGGGGSSSGATGETAADSGSNGQANQQSEINRGIKGESPTAEAASKARISAADCGRLAKAAGRSLGRRLTHQSSPHPPASKCTLAGGGASVSIYLDASFAAHQRYYNRIDETVQFGEGDPARNPQPVPHVGERAIDNSAASWIPALGSLLAVRGNRWLTVTISVPGQPSRRQRDEAADLALLGFHLTPP